MKKRMITTMLAAAMATSLMTGVTVFADGYNIGYSNMALKEDFFITVEAGISKACEEKGYTYNNPRASTHSCTTYYTCN